jgi:hypothetical protein
MSALKRIPRLNRPAAWALEMDFVGPRHRTSVWGWALLGLGLLMALLALDDAMSVQSARQDAEGLIQRLSRAEHQQKVAQQAKVQAVAASSPAGVVPVLARADWRHAVQLALWLGHDWRGTLDRVDEQAAQGKVVLTGFSLDLATLGESESSQPEWRLQAAVPDDEVALRWVQSLGPQAQLRSRQALNTPFTGTQGTYAWRVDAVLGGAQP